MSLDPCRTLMHHKRWATMGLNSIIGEARARIPSDDWMLVLMLLDHIQIVDDIFRHHLGGARTVIALSVRRRFLPSKRLPATQARPRIGMFAMSTPSGRIGWTSKSPSTLSMASGRT